MSKPTALLASWEKDDSLVLFARELLRLNYDLLASAGTAAFLKGHDVPVRDVAEIVGEPILGHRVVTLDRRIYAALLADYRKEEDMRELEKLGMPAIDLVYVTLYPLNAAFTDPKATYDSVIEKIDIGGPTLLRAAAKGGRLVVSSPEQYSTLIAALVELRGDPNNLRVSRLYKMLQARLAAQAEERVAQYTATAAAFYSAVYHQDFRFWH